MTQTGNPSKKLASRKLVLILAALFAITLVGLNIAVAAYFAETNAKDTQIKQLNDQIDSIQAQISSLNLTTPAPNLISVGMQYNDNRTNTIAPFLEITGYVINVGTAQANNITVRVFAIQDGNNTAIDISSPINSLAAGNYEKIDLLFPYTGSPLIAYSSNLQWG